MKERTLAIIKPDAMERELIGTIIQRYEKEKMRIVAMKMTRITKEQAKGFYAEHTGKPFFENLVSYISSGPVVLLVLEGNGVINHHREVMGATDPAKAKEGTLRKQYGLSIDKNSVHGSDSPTSAQREIQFFFPDLK